MKKRLPVVSGYFYPSDKRELESLIEWSFTHPIGPGTLPKISATRRKETIGYISPHAGYIYSGPVAAHTYFQMAMDGAPETVIILGTNHTGYGALVSIYPGGTWETPLGSMEVDSELGKAIAEKSHIAELDEYAHVEEHSIEVQLPFIQYIYGNRVRILPVVLGLHTPDTAMDLARSIMEAVSSLKRDVILVASSDFNHYDPHEITVKKDSDAISMILRLDSLGFYNTLLREDISVCGPGGIMVLIEYSKLLLKEKARAELLKYATSGDVSGDKSHVVGYASIRFSS
ncbi:MAG: AmmeMemoRadiSam system protein B [Thermosphaera sp.]